MKIAMTVNGKSVSRDVAGNTLLVEYIRDHLRLTGTHVGCDTSQCGACVVHVDGKAMKSCTMLAASAEGAAVTTVEGLAKSKDELHPMQVAFKENHGLQCGFCTPGMIMSAVGFLNRNPDPAPEEIAEGLEGNLCRCGTYNRVVDAVETAARELQSEDGS